MPTSSRGVCHAGQAETGPIAQDFHAAFGPGIDDRHIVTVDTDGVALAAIQGLYRLIDRQQEEIYRLTLALAEVARGR